MRINGGWFLGADGIGRPVIWAQILTHHGPWMAAPLVNTGADRTVLSTGVLATLQLPTLVTHERLGGVGGMVPPVLVDTQVRFVQEAGGPITIRGQYAAVTAPDALDMSVLGRDVTGLFAVIVDQPG